MAIVPLTFGRHVPIIADKVMFQFIQLVYVLVITVVPEYTFARISCSLGSFLITVVYLKFRTTHQLSP